jgi:hypothetical protein
MEAVRTALNRAKAAGARARRACGLTLFLTGASATATREGIRNILALRGDPPKGAESWEAVEDGWAPCPPPSVYQIADRRAALAGKRQKTALRTPWTSSSSSAVSTATSSALVGRRAARLAWLSRAGSRCRLPGEAPHRDQPRGRHPAPQGEGRCEWLRGPPSLSARVDGRAAGRRAPISW